MQKTFLFTARVLSLSYSVSGNFFSLLCLQFFTMLDAKPGHQATIFRRRQANMQIG